MIRDCRIGYRVAGQLTPDKSNVIVLTTWFAGRSGDMGGWVGEGKLFDTSKDYVIVIDAIGNGVSSSPSNSAAQPREQFPRFTIRDMVRSQHELLTRELHLDHVYAVGGLSMGGMQTFQWIASYPDFMTKAVAIVGTPKQTSYDLLLWQSELDLIEMTHYSRDAMNVLVRMNDMTLYTPEWVVNHVKDVGKSETQHAQSLADRDLYDYASDLRSMIAHDITPDFHPPLKPKMLVVVSQQDHTVNPAPAIEFARKYGAELFTLTGDCGHLATSCETDAMSREVRRFLSGP